MIQEQFDIICKDWADGLYEYIRNNKKEKIDLSGVNFSHFNHKDFKTKNVFDLKFINANLNETIFIDFNLSAVYFTNSLIKKSSFKFCNLENAIFAGADLSKSEFIKCNINNCNFKVARVSSQIYNQLTDLQKKDCIRI